jgi:cation transporter-like permease
MSALPQASWKIRRRVMFVVLAFCMAVIGWLTYAAPESRVAETIVLCAFGLMGLIVSVYVLGATWEDVTRIKLGGLNAGPQ